MNLSSFTKRDPFLGGIRVIGVAIILGTLYKLPRLFLLSHFWAVIVAGLALWAGWRCITWSSRPVSFHIPPVPDGFTPTHSHTNISLDATAGRLWLRDQSGAVKVFAKSEILDWKVIKNARHPGRKGLRIERTNLTDQLLIITTDAALPEYVINFNAGDAMCNPDQDLRNAAQWSDKLKGFVGIRKQE